MNFRPVVRPIATRSGRIITRRELAYPPPKRALQLFTALPRSSSSFSTHSSSHGCRHNSTSTSPEIKTARNENRIESAEAKSARLEVAQEICGYRFTNVNMLSDALTARYGPAESAGSKHFSAIGHLAISLAMQAECYRANLDGGRTLILHSYLTNPECLAGICDQVGLTACINYPKHAFNDGPVIKSKALRAVIGAVYQDGGMNAAEAVMIQLGILIK